MPENVRHGLLVDLSSLPLAIGIVMLGLGLSLTLDDFRRVGRYPKAAVVALLCQIVLLPAICFGLPVAQPGAFSGTVTAGLCAWGTPCAVGRELHPAEP
ncbi:putative Na+-dependent transporter [Nonomuraea thailandensis]|uniref:Na+-dependent transporter n=1 Tax=Nonomuraea thailandensis TaxID=1188745 RepID=A0A9X2K9Q9_9ACTN|nr:hypothetical protein [Nonomuraea thailandensis]MCP2365363.1 putative Na+-dependent transporter [Nonomuraea thailandensis]